MVMRRYSAEFRVEAVALYRSRPDATIKAVAADLGVNHVTLGNWIRLDARPGPQSPATGSAATSSAVGSAADENAVLRRRVRELEEERDILRKAARYFAGETRW